MELQSNIMCNTWTSLFDPSKNDEKTELESSELAVSVRGLSKSDGSSSRYFRSLKKINFSPRCASTTRETKAFRPPRTETPPVV